MRRRLRMILKAKLTFIICIIIFVVSIFMANGYAIFKTKLNIVGSATIEEVKKEKWEPNVSFRQTLQIGPLFFYDIVIKNTSSLTYKDWKVKIYDDNFIMLPYGIDGIREDDGWLLSNSNWDSRIEPGKTVIVTITIMVTSEDLPNEMTVEEYAKYYVEHCVEVSGDYKEENRDGNIIRNGNASLSLKESEVEVTNFAFQENKEYESKQQNEKQYILNITNDSNSKYIKIRVNIATGTNKVLEVSPSEITCDHGDNVTFELASWTQIGEGETISIYVAMLIQEENFNPDIVVAATIE